MKTVETVIICLILFVFTGVVAYLLEAIWFRRIGKIGRYESLWEYFRKIDQKNGNITAAVWAGIWIGLMIVTAAIIYVMQ